MLFGLIHFVFVVIYTLLVFIHLSFRFFHLIFEAFHTPLRLVHLQFRVNHSRFGLVHLRFNGVHRVFGVKHFTPFFFLDEKETGQRCKGIFEPVCAAGSKERAPLSQYFLCLETKKQNSRLFKIEMKFYAALRRFQELAALKQLEIFCFACLNFYFNFKRSLAGVWTPAPDLCEQLYVKNEKLNLITKQ